MNETAEVDSANNNSVYYSAASSDSSEQNPPEEEEEEEEDEVEVNFDDRREHQRHEYRRRLTLDPLTDFIVNGGNMLLEEAGSDADTSGDEQQQQQQQQHNDDSIHNIVQQNQAVNQQQPVERDSEHDDDDAVRRQLLALLGHEMMMMNDHDDDGDSSSDNNGDNNNNDDGDVSHLLARDHAYLPTAQPLYPEEWIPAGRHRNRNRVHRLSESFINIVDKDYRSSQSLNENTATDTNFNSNSSTRTKSEAESSTHYEITEPPDAQSFAPTHRSLHSNKEIEEEEEEQSTKNVLAIMEVGDVVLFPGSVIPLRITDPVWINYLGTLIDDARGLYGYHSDSAGGMGEVQIGILPRISYRTRRRQVPRRSSSSTVSTEPGGRMGRWRVDLIRRGVAAVRRPGRRRRVDTGDENEGESSSHNEPSMEERGSNRDERREESEEENSEEDEYFQPSTISSPSPYVGRVGTFATITFTHEEAALSNIDGAAETAGGSVNMQERSHSRVWQRHRGEIVLTALGTKRFRIVAPIAVDAHPDYRDRRYHGILFEVEEMSHFGAPMPPTWMLRSPGDFRYPIVTQSNSHVNAIWHLAQRSSSPATAYQNVWPWRVAQKICNLIQQTEQFQGSDSCGCTPRLPRSTLPRNSI